MGSHGMRMGHMITCFSKKTESQGSTEHRLRGLTCKTRDSETRQPETPHQGGLFFTAAARGRTVRCPSVPCCGHQGAHSSELAFTLDISFQA